VHREFLLFGKIVDPTRDVVIFFFKLFTFTKNAGKAAVIGSNPIISYLLLFFPDKVKIKKMANGNDQLWAVSTYMRNRAATDIQEWLRRVKSGAVPRRRNPQEKLDEITELTAQVLFPATSAKAVQFRSAKKLRELTANQNPGERSGDGRREIGTKLPSVVFEG
jgi:hypothetical protein